MNLADNDDDLLLAAEPMHDRTIGLTDNLRREEMLVRVTAGAATGTNKQKKRWAYLWGKQTEVSRWCANRGVTRGSAVRLQAGRSLAKRCIEGGLQVRRRSEQKNKSALSGSDRGSLYTCGGSTIHYL